MKKSIIAVCLLLSIYYCNAQDYEDYGLQRIGNNYQNGISQVRNAYNDLMNLQLVNAQDAYLLNQYKQQVKQDAEKQQNYKLYDFSMPSNVANVVNFINTYLQVQNIKNEKEVLEKIRAEMDRLKQRNPESFTSSDRYKELMDVLKSMSNCFPSDITDIALKHGVF